MNRKNRLFARSLHSACRPAAVGLTMVAALLLSACSQIDENERLIETPPVVVPLPDSPDPTDSLYDAPATPVPRRLLIEDHTGQHCPNCPTATNAIHQLQELYGSLIVPVAIHSRELGIMEADGGLGNELGNTYYSYWNIKAKPAGLVSRMDGGVGVVMDWTLWPLAVEYFLTLETPLDIRLRTSVTDGQADIDVKVLCTREEAAVAGKLQVWITEDSIVAVQDSLAGTRIDRYVHNHVLRSAVNGAWGEDISVGGMADMRELHYSLPLTDGWDPRHLAVVAFVYTDTEVVQVVKKELNQ